MPNIEDYRPESRYKLLGVGDSGSGKSTAFASFPQPYHELDFDDRFGGIWQAVQQGILTHKLISYQGFDLTAGWNPVGKELDRLNMQKMAWQSNPGVNTFKYKSLGVGSLSSVRRLVLQLATAKMPGHVKLGNADDKFPLILGAPGDTKAEGSGVNQVLDIIFGLPCNILVTAHICERYGKPKDAYLPDGSVRDEYKFRQAEIIGERLTLSPNVAAEILTRFDNVFKFQSRIVGNVVKYEVIFTDGDIAKNGFGIPPGAYDFTGKEFYPFFLELVGKYSKSEAKKA